MHLLAAGDQLIACSGGDLQLQMQVQARRAQISASHHPYLFCRYNIEAFRTICSKTLLLTTSYTHNTYRRLFINSSRTSLLSTNQPKKTQDGRETRLQIRKARETGTANAEALFTTSATFSTSVDTDSCCARFLLLRATIHILLRPTRHREASTVTAAPGPAAQGGNTGSRPLRSPYYVQMPRR